MDLHQISSSTDDIFSFEKLKSSMELNKNTPPVPLNENKREN